METERTCLACKEGKMKPFLKVPHPNGVITIYWRCSKCHHVWISHAIKDDRE